MTAPPTNPAYTLGVDTGGTFTDLILLDPQRRRLATHKLLSTPDDPARAVLAGIEALRPHLPPHARLDVTHGSTVATNALIEHTRKGDPRSTVFLTTAGFEDTLHIGRQHRPDLYALVPQRAAPPIPRACCIGVNERMGFDGQPIRALTAQTLQQAVAAVVERSPRSVVISLLHSYANPSHEQQLAEAIKQAMGEAVQLTVSSALIPEPREYERAATCVINGVVAPTMHRYLGRLSERLGSDRLRIMGSEAGTLPVSLARREPVRTILSGPAGGVLGAQRALAEVGVTDLITLDMGGTSTDVALCTAEGLSMTTRGEAAGLPVGLPMVDVHAVGAGGGSLAWVDPGGALRVGPASAGAAPGPACYGQGGTQATVTDAHVVLGNLPPDLKLAGTLPMDVDAAHQAVETIAQTVQLSIEQTAQGILRIAEATMAQAVKRISLQRGHDPRRFTLVPFGGAGGLHACALAEALGMTRVVVPTHPGLLSAVGMLVAPAMVSRSRACLCPPDSSRVQDTFEALHREAQAELRDQRLDPEKAQYRFRADLRYAGQSHEITVAYDEHVLQRFESEHQRLYGHNPDRPVELVVARVHATVEVDRLQLGQPDRQGDDEQHVRSRGSLGVGEVIQGPTTIVEFSSTTRVPAGWTLTVMETGALRLEARA